MDQIATKKNKINPSTVIGSTELIRFISTQGVTTSPSYALAVSLSLVTKSCENTTRYQPARSRISRFLFSSNIWY